MTGYPGNLNVIQARQVAGRQVEPMPTVGEFATSAGALVIGCAALGVLFATGIAIEGIEMAARGAKRGLLEVERVVREGLEAL